MPRPTLQPATTYSAIVGSVLGQLREQQGLRQEEVARALGVTQATMSRMESGQSGISVEQLRVLAPSLDSTPGKILAYAEDVEMRFHNQGVAVTVKKDDERLETALILIGLAAVVGLAALAISSSKKG